jgi:hypothetical protein
VFRGGGEAAYEANIRAIRDAADASVGRIV